MDFPGGSDGKASAYTVGDPGSIPGSGRSLEKEMVTGRLWGLMKLLKETA